MHIFAHPSTGVGRGSFFCWRKKQSGLQELVQELANSFHFKGMSQEFEHGADGQQPYDEDAPMNSGDDEEEPVEFKAPRAPRKLHFAAKQPRRPPPMGYIERRDLYAEEEYSEDPEDVGAPDVQTYLKQFGLSNQQEIAICRTYANMLSAKVRSVPRGPYKKRSRTSQRDFE